MSRETIEKLLKLTSGREPVKILRPNNITNFMEEPRKDQLKNDEDLKDRASNRNQREEFTKKIILMMACEVLFIAVLLFGVFITPYINSLAPKIQLNLPPIFYTLSIIIVLAVSYRVFNRFPQLTISKKGIFQFSIDIGEAFKYISIIMVICIMNHVPRHPYTICFEPIVLSENIINMIIYASITVFIKTTILAGFIINGLYDVLRKK